MTSKGLREALQRVVDDHDLSMADYYAKWGEWNAGPNSIDPYSYARAALSQPSVPAEDWQARAIEAERRLEELRALSEAATPGEWEMVWPSEQGGAFTAWGKIGHPPTGWVIPLCASGVEHNVAFIVAAVNYVRAALSETPDEASRT